jgi:2-oxo-4-hydroxy-4-carboxy-5-ureidoimidazoline decarboxylase
MERWRRVNEAAAEEARELLTACCGSARWVEAMLGRRPFASQEAAFAAARHEWFRLSPDDWREAFSHHPRIGDRESLRARFPLTHQLSAREQASVADAGDALLDALADANERYLQKLGYIFIVCATGQRSDEMLALLEARLQNDPDTEILIAAEEQARITAIRLRDRGPDPARRTFRAVRA